MKTNDDAYLSVPEPTDTGQTESIDQWLARRNATLILVGSTTYGKTTDAHELIKRLQNEQAGSYNNNNTGGTYETQDY